MSESIDNYDPASHYFPDLDEKLISLNQAINALKAYKKLWGGGDHEERAFLLRSCGEEIEIVSFGKYSSSSVASCVKRSRSYVRRAR